MENGKYWVISDLKNILMVNKFSETLRMSSVFIS